MEAISAGIFMVSLATFHQKRDASLSDLRDWLPLDPKSAFWQHYE
jgi:hypothetical protein